jgi:hypothetical protein
MVVIIRSQRLNWFGLGKARRAIALQHALKMCGADWAEVPAPSGELPHKKRRVPLCGRKIWV